jgi:hypothetical protein
MLQWCKIVLPHIGLIALSCIYVLIGATVFFYLERPHEYLLRDTNRRLIAQHRRDLFDHLYTRRKTRFPRPVYRHADRALSPSTPLDGMCAVPGNTLTCPDHLLNLTTVLWKAFDTHYISAAHLTALGASNGTGGGVQPVDAWTMMSAIFFTSTLLTTIGERGVCVFAHCAQATAISCQ